MNLLSNSGCLSLPCPSIAAVEKCSIELTLTLCTVSDLDCNDVMCYCEECHAMGISMINQNISLI